MLRPPTAAAIPAFFAKVAGRIWVLARTGAPRVLVRVAAITRHTTRTAFSATERYRATDSSNAPPSYTMKSVALYLSVALNAVLVVCLVMAATRTNTLGAPVRARTQIRPATFAVIDRECSNEPRMRDDIQCSKMGILHFSRKILLKYIWIKKRKQIFTQLKKMERLKEEELRDGNEIFHKHRKCLRL